MIVELRLRGEAHRLAGIVFEGYSVTVDGSETVVRGEARDEVDAVGLIERASDVGFSVTSWRLVG